VTAVTAVLEYRLTKYRQSWRGALFNSLTFPVLLLFGVGLSVGSYVNRHGTLGVPYLEFVAPGLLASSTLQLAMTEAGAPVFNSFHWERSYYGMITAPTRALDIITGELAYLALRMAPTALIFTALMAALGGVHSSLAIALPVIAVLVGLAGAAPMLAYAASVSTVLMMSVMLRFSLLPMTLFSGVFFPITRLPAVIRPVAYALPLWHGVQLSRAAASGVGGMAAACGHLLVLLLWCAAGIVVAHGRFVRRLTP
jgi:lipooligosaccharide transport system permease protein